MKETGMLHMTLYVPAGESAARVARLQAAMKAEGFDAFLLTQNADIFYMTGSMQSGYVWIPAEGEPFYYVKRSIARAAEESLVRSGELGSFRDFGAALARDFPAVGGDKALQIGTPFDVLPAQLYLKLNELLAAALQARLADGSALMRRVRMIKSRWELERISAAAGVVAEALAEALNDLREGVREVDWIARFEHEIRIRGHIGLMRMRGYNQEIMTGMVGSGAAAAEPSYFDGPAGGRGLGPSAPQSVSRKSFERNEPILIDVGCCIDGYVIDQTRTAVIGELPEDLEQAYGVSETIIRRAEKRMLPGAAPEELYAGALEDAAEAGLAAHFMGFGADQVKFLGHGIGLEVDEWPVLARGFREPLLPGMVLAVEPKFTFPGRGVVGIENTYAVSAEGARALTLSPEGIIRLP
jgi:Xaa-Pro aminopeptidase